MIEQRRSVLTILTGLLLICLASVAAHADARPNVVFIVVDDLGWRDLGCYGSTFYKTPHIDELAKKGMRFTNAYAANPTCSPTRSSILTGLYPVRTGFLVPSGHVKGEKKQVELTRTHPDLRAAGPTSVNFLNPKYYTLGEAMKDAEYATAFLGKWHLGHAPHIPENNGFDYVVGGRHHPGPPGKDRSRAFFAPWNADTLPGKLTATVTKDTHIDDYLADRAVDYIARHKGKPFFMCLWPYSVHAPFQSKPELVEKWKKKVDLKNPQHCPTMAAMIEVVDASIGRVLKALEKNGIADNTIVILTSDNGGNMYNTADGTTPTNNAPLRGGKGTNYEGGPRVPLIVRWPGNVKAGAVNGDVISTVDHYPTILSMTGQKARPEAHKDGVSFLPALKGKKHDRGPTICAWTAFTSQTNSLPSTSIITGEWKLLRFWFGGPDQTHRYELYHLKDDIGEAKDLVAKHPERVKAMARQMDEFYAKSGSLKPNANENYHGRSVGVWVVDENCEGTVSKDEVKLKSKAVEVFASTRVVPFVDGTAIIELQARSETGHGLALQWKAGTRKKPGTFNADQSHDMKLPKEWKTFRLTLNFEGRLAGLRLKLNDKGGTAEVRNIRVLTKDGSPMTHYRF